MNYLKDQLGIKPPDTVDLCNEWGNLKLLFLLKDQYENIGNIFELRENCYACRIQRIPPEMAYKAFIPLIDDAADNMLENLQQQCEELEHIRQEEVLGEERKQLLEATISSTQTKMIRNSSKTQQASPQPEEDPALRKAIIIKSKMDVGKRSNK
ncbi:uncharacterized protein CXorf65 homolog [Callorhinchus milii]|uniref:Uncharacterized protein n=1 Tax=Callorhinchus milii TaxID=7868 RepID=V9LH53_CALMI|nr:uncharacterized protein CXorf65 homolog [Callorhinchus milii]XP_007892347.1 uncharacterized protein CXorf65 homolog [Callorhinchus milii]XP_042196738.1 uncharacterized protein CXorf65 homolog [Callorhinchus milii]|eukprot:gi/632936089/ref/XP_007892339.1/ PREDICTED: uncharacterized protein CXorf65 homolog [Callorhinchus milii]